MDTIFVKTKNNKGLVRINRDDYNSEIHKEPTEKEIDKELKGAESRMIIAEKKFKAERKAKAQKAKVENMNSLKH